MSGRKTDDITRVDIRIPNELYDEISQIAIAYFNAKIHHRSNKPEITPTILELIKIGIAHLDTTKDVENRTSIDELEAIASLDARLTEVENKLSKASIEQRKSYKVEEQPTEYDSSEGKEILSDKELSFVLGVSNLLIRDYRVKNKKPRGSFLAKALTEEWEIRGEGWVKK